MALHVGDAVTVRAQARHPFSKRLLTTLTGTAEFFAPGRDPKNNPAERATPDATVGVVYDEEAEGYVASWPSVGPAGRWTVLVRLTGDSYSNTEFGSFNLKP